MSKCYIQLGRTGDILNVLPMLWADAQGGERSSIIVSREYSTVLEGASYFDLTIFDGPPHDIPGAIALAESEGLNWRCTQVNGPTDIVREVVYKRAGLDRAVTTSFQKEQWRVAGRLHEFGNYPLVFDRRDLDREAILYDSVVKKKSRYLLVSPSGISSPFPYRELLLELVRHCGLQVVDLSQVKAERFYDLLGLFERAECLVSIDTAALHLAYACPKLPVVALVNDRPTLWNGSSWRGQHEFYCRYHDFPDRAVEMVNLIRSLKSLPKHHTITHVWNSASEMTPRSSPGELWKLTPITPGMAARLGPPESPSTPYLRDCIRMGLQRTHDDIWLCLTGPKVELDDPNKLSGLLMQARPCFAYRIAKNGDEVQAAPVVDLFCASGRWWREHMGDIPDLLFGNDYFWRHCLWAFFNKRGAVDITPAVSVQTAPKAPAPISPPAAFNSVIANQYIADKHIASRYPKVSEQVHCQHLEPGGLKPFAYNPSILEHEEMLLLAYRYHPDTKSPSTRIVLSQIDFDGAVLSNRELELDCKSAEDPKLFLGPLRHPYMAFVASSLPILPARAVVRFSQLVNGKPWEIVTPNIGKNDETAIEKNWVFWFDRGQMNVIYTCHPTHKVFQGGKDGWTLHETPGPRWPWGPIKGGTPPIEFDGKWLRFFHSTQDNEFGGYPRRYFVGALLMEKTSPFRVLRVSNKPVLYGSEVDDIKVKDRPPHWKPNVVFPGGAIYSHDKIILAVGVNDASCKLCTLEVTDLNL